MQTCDVDIDREVSKVSQAEPFIAVTGRAGEENAQFYVICEKSVLLECKTLCDALIDQIASYYVFDIAYPKSVAGVMLFFQHHVFSLKDKQQPRALTCLCKLIQNIHAMD